MAAENAVAPKLAAFAGLSRQGDVEDAFTPLLHAVVIRRRRRPFGLASQDVAGATWSGYRCRHVTRIPLAPCGHGP